MNNGYVSLYALIRILYDYDYDYEYLLGTDSIHADITHVTKGHIAIHTILL